MKFPGKPAKPPEPKEPSRYIDYEFKTSISLQGMRVIDIIDSSMKQLLGWVHYSPDVISFMKDHPERFVIELENYYGNEYDEYITFRVTAEDKLVPNHQYDSQLKTYLEKVQQYPIKLAAWEVKFEEWKLQNEEAVKNLKAQKIAQAKKLLKEAGEL